MGKGPLVPHAQGRVALSAAARVSGFRHKAAHAAPEVAERAVVVPKACDRAPPTLRPHARAVAVGHWASHARTRRMRIGSMSGPARRCALAPCPYPITHSSGLWGGKLQTQASFTSWQGYRKGFSLCDTRVLTRELSGLAATNPRQVVDSLHFPPPPVPGERERERETERERERVHALFVFFKTRYVISPFTSPQSPITSGGRKAGGLQPSPVPHAVALAKKSICC